MFMLVIVALAVALVPVARGDLRALARVPFRAAWLLWVALGLQLALMIWSGPRNGFRDAAHYGSYALGVVFLGANARRLAGMWVVAAGTASNLAAIMANGGVMPASRHALESAGLSLDPGVFANSIVVEGARLRFLGDVFWIPNGWPLANVFSVGDVLIALGAAIVVHAVCGSRLIPARWRGAGPARD